MGPLVKLLFAELAALTAVAGDADGKLPYDIGELFEEEDDV